MVVPIAGKAMMLESLVWEGFKGWGGGVEVLDDPGGEGEKLGLRTLFYQGGEREGGLLSLTQGA